MSPAFDPIIRLALALNASRGAYAVLLGSGISAAAGVPTGRQIVADLVTKLAALEGEAVGTDPELWYRRRFGEAPDYSRLLDALAGSRTERNELLRRYFEPAADPRAPGPRPSAAHRALARLAAHGYVSVFLTTNFDRLLEQALEAEGVAPSVLSTPDSLAGTLPLGRTRCTVIKLNGDYLDTRIKNTPEELAAYDPEVDRLLDRVLDEYGLVVCGWSADWDTALRQAFERIPSRRYTTFWAARAQPSGLAAELVALRQAEVIRIADADSFFTDLASRLAALDAGPAAPPQGRGGRTTTALPARAAAFVGRRAELRDVAQRLRDPASRLLTLVGPGGTGKTALAIQAATEVAGDFPDGVAFVDLSGARDTDAVLVALTRALGLEEAIGRPLDQALVEFLNARRMLLVLDNFEQALAAAGIVAQLLAGCPGLTVLVTSRADLRLRGEHLYPVPPLALPAAGAGTITARQLERYESAQLFLDRARAVRPDFRLTDRNAPVVAEICRRLDGLPLAIELAAAQLRLVSPETLQEQLRERFKHLRGGPRDLPERQRTLRAAMDWSYDLLTPGEQRLLELLSVFAGADMPAVEAVAARALPAGVAIGDVADGIAGLVEKSLLLREDPPAGGLRVAMLETIRAYAADRLAQRGDFARQAREAHATYFAELASRLNPDLAGSRRLDVLAAMAADAENFAIAWAHWLGAGDLPQLQGMAEPLLTLDEARGWYRAIVSLATDMLAVLERSAASPAPVDQEIALRTTLARALLATRGFTREVEDAFAKGIALCERGGDTRSHFSALRGQTYLYSLGGDRVNAARTGAALLAFAERENDPAMLVEAHLRVGASKVFVSDLVGGLEHLDKAMAQFPAVSRHGFAGRAGGNDPRVACFTTSAIALWLLGRADQAVARADAGLAFAAELGHPFTLAYAHFHAGLLQLWRRDFETTLARAADALAMAETHDFQIWKATGSVLSGAAQVGLGRPAEGLAVLRGGMDLYRGLRSPPVFWPLLLAIQAGACLDAGLPSDALAPLDAALEIMAGGDGTTLLPELWLLKGDLLRAGAVPPGDADGDPALWYRKALERARALQAKTSELRAATRLCRLASGEAERSAAQRTLAALLAGFSAETDTHDLSEARALLDPVAAPG